MKIEFLQIKPKHINEDARRISPEARLNKQLRYLPCETLLYCSLQTSHSWRSSCAINVITPMIAGYLDDGRSLALGQPILEQNGANDTLTIEKGSQTDPPAFFLNPEYLNIPATKHQAEYLDADPFPHGYVDDFPPEWVIDQRLA